MIFEDEEDQELSDYIEKQQDVFIENFFKWIETQDKSVKDSFELLKEKGLMNSTLGVIKLVWFFISVNNMKELR